MSQNFLKFKRRLSAIRIIRALMVGLSCGMIIGGGGLLLWKLAVLEFNPIISLYAGLGAFALSGIITFLLGGKNNKTLARELDSRFDLKARVQTMIAYGDEEGEMFALQREDAERALASVPLKSYKFKGLAVYLTVFVLSVALITSGVVVKDTRSYGTPEGETVVPFELSEVQENGLKEIIKNVQNSELEEEFKAPMVAELEALLEALKSITTEPEMLEAVNGSMAVICSITYQSSTAAEVLNGLWDSQDIYLRYLAKALDTSEWDEPSWSDFAESFQEYSLILTGEAENEEAKNAEKPTLLATLKWRLDTMSRSIESALRASEKFGVGEDDEIRTAISTMFERNPGGLKVLLSGIDYMSEQEALDALALCFEFSGKELFDAISLNKANANVGEDAMTRLSVLFSISLPEFERPEFYKTGESVEGNQGAGEDNNEDKKPTDGGIGEGAVYGSDDLVLNHLTGEYVKLGELINTYHTLMNERLQGDFYTEEQKKAIIKYFELLFSGIEKEEGK